MKPTRFTPLAIVTFLVSLSLLAGAVPPDTPPTLAWSIVLGGESPCIASTGFIDSIDFDTTGNAYVSGRCATTLAATTVFVFLNKVSTSGAIAWTFTWTCGGSQQCGSSTVKVDAAGRPVLMFEDPAITATSKTRLAIHDPATGGLIFDVVDKFTIARAADDSTDALDWRVCGPTCIDYFIGGGNFRGAIRCDGPNQTDEECAVLWEFLSASRGCVYITWASPTADELYCADSTDGAGNGVVFEVDPDTGAVPTSPYSWLLTTYTSPRSPLWLSSATSAYEFATKLGVSGQLFFTELDPTSMTGVRNEVLPTDNDLGAGGSISDAQLDAQDDGFACGATTDAYILKTDTVALAAVRWTILVNVDGAQAETATICRIGPDGGLYVAGFYALTGGSFPASNNWLRKYADAGSPRPRHDLEDFEGFGEEVVPPGFEGSDFGTGIVQFATDIGFQSPGGLFFFGLILVIIMFLVVAGAVKGVSDSAIAAMVGGSVAGMGTMVFNTTQELWHPSATVILIILTSAVILYFTRTLFTERFSGG